MTRRCCRALTSVAKADAPPPQPQQQPRQTSELRVKESPSEMEPQSGSRVGREGEDAMDGGNRWTHPPVGERRRPRRMQRSSPVAPTARGVRRVLTGLSVCSPQRRGCAG